MKTSTYLNKMKSIRDKASAPVANIIAAPAMIKSKMSQSKSTANFNVLKQANAIPKNAPDYNSNGDVTDTFKVKSVAEGVKMKMKKK